MPSRRSLQPPPADSKLLEAAPPGAALRLFSAALPLVLVVLGIALRLQRYFLGRSFRNDEAALALALVRSSVQSLISQPLPGGLTAPLGFLIVEKLIVQALGNWDYVFRLLPLVAGCASMVLLCLLTRRLLGPLGSTFVLGAFAVNWMLLLYSSDFKQYSSDVFFVVLLYLALALYLRASTSANRLALAGIGAVALTFSHPSIFVLGSIGAVLLIHHRRDRAALAWVFGIVLVWALSFAGLYFNYYRVVGQERGVVDYWNNLEALMPMPPWEDPAWFAIRAASFFTTVAGLAPLTLLNTAILAAGLLSFYRRGLWQWSLVLLGTLVLPLVASGVINYPFKGRLILFLVPVLYLAMGEGLDWLTRLARSRRWYVQALGGIAVIALLWSPVSGTLAVLGQRRSTPYREDLKPVLAFVQQHWRPDDLIVVYDQASITYEYYAPFHGLATAQHLFLENHRNNPRRYRLALDALPGQQRTWFIFSSVLDMPDDTDVRTFLLDYAVASGGKVLEQYNYDSVSFADLVLTK